MLSALLERVAAALEQEGLDYMVIGGQAVLLYGEPRLTKDIDITLGIPPTEVHRVIAMAESLDLEVLVADPVDFAARTSVLPCGEGTTTLRVDFIFSWSPYEVEALKRVRRQHVGSALVRFASPEDIVVHKVIAGRPRDIEDVRGILIRSGNLDSTYIRNWLAQFDAALSADYVSRFDELLRR